MFHDIDMTIVTTWLLYRSDCSTGLRKEEQIRLYTFNSYIMESLWKEPEAQERSSQFHNWTPFQPLM